MARVTRATTMTVRGVEVQVAAYQVWRCEDSGEEFEDEEMVDANLAQAWAAYHAQLPPAIAAPKNLVEGLTDEILRVSEIQREYNSLPRGAGELGAHVMGIAIAEGRAAQASGDILLNFDFHES